MNLTLGKSRREWPSPLRRSVYHDIEGHAPSAMIETKTTTALCIYNVVVLFNVFKKFKRGKNPLQINDLWT